MSRSAMAKTQPGESTRRHGWWGAIREVLLILAVALALSFLVKTFVFRTFFIPSESMEPTLHVSDRVAVGIIGFSPESLKRGDVVVFRDDQEWLPELPAHSGTPLTGVFQFVGLAPENPDQYLVKRVIGLPGDRVASEGLSSTLTINGEPLEEPYLASGVWSSNEPFDVTVPQGSLWVMGDNRPHSADSRFHVSQRGGFVDFDSVVGRVNAIFWPIERWGTPQ